MAGAACKVVINQGLRALSESIERILIDDNVHGGRLPEEVRQDLIQRLADVDIASYTGQALPPGGLGGILTELERHGIITAEVYEVFAKPVDRAQTGKPRGSKPDQ